MPPEPATTPSPSARRRARRDRFRAALTLGLAIAQPLSTQLASWTGRGTPEIDRAAATEGPVTPAPATFAIWGPLFAGSITYAALDLRAARPPATGQHAARRARNLAAAALLGNVAWSVNAQFRRLDELSVAIIACSAAAATAAVNGRPTSDPTGAPPVALALHAAFGSLAGWLTLATAANIETTLNFRWGRPRRRTETLRAVGLLGLATAITTTVQKHILRGNPAYALAVGWGLAGAAINAVRNRRPAIAITTVLAATALATTTARARQERRQPDRCRSRSTNHRPVVRRGHGVGRPPPGRWASARRRPAPGTATGPTGDPVGPVEPWRCP